MLRPFIKISIAASSILFLACPGCSSPNPPTYIVYGQVEFDDGKPLQIGSIEFRSQATSLQNQERILARGEIKQDGSFSLTTFSPGDGAVEGAHQVVIHQMIITEDVSFKSHGHGRRSPRMYADYGTSNLKANVRRTDDKNDKLTNAIVIKLQIDPADKKR